MSSQSYYIDEDTGRDDDSAQGTESAPYKTLLHAMKRHGADSVSYMSRKAPTGANAETEPAGWKPVSDSATKKARKLYEQYKRKEVKAAELATRGKEDAASRQQLLEDAKKVLIEEDASLPAPVEIDLDEKDPSKIKLGSGDTVGTRVMVQGYVHRYRSQKDLMFITLRDGFGKMQVVFSGKLIRTYAAMTLTLETTLEIRGELRSLPEGAKAPLNRELHADYFKVIGAAAGGEDAITNKVQADADNQTLLDQRHLTLRGDVLTKVQRVRGAVIRGFRQTYLENRYEEVTPPALVQTQVEGGATLFEFEYYGEKAYLTQSSQMYLETCIPSLKRVFCICPSFRAEKSLTRRHLSEFMHIEAELNFITFDKLLSHLESIICRVVELTLSDPVIAEMVKELNPDFKPPTRPFKRMKYSDAIQWLIDNDIPNENGEPHTIGDDIAEAAERKMTDILNVPILLTHFPVEIKAFYMKKDEADKTVTESVDVLMPGVGEIVGGSMRIDDYDELMAAYHREGLDPAPYYWYTDQRKYGSAPHGGYGLGLERFLAWMCGRYTVRDCTLYPRYPGRCTP